MLLLRFSLIGKKFTICAVFDSKQHLNRCRGLCKKRSVRICEKSSKDEIPFFSHRFKASEESQQLSKLSKHVAPETASYLSGTESAMSGFDFGCERCVLSQTSAERYCASALPPVILYQPLTRNKQCLCFCWLSCSFQRHDCSNCQ